MQLLIVLLDLENLHNHSRLLTWGYFDEFDLIKKAAGFAEGEKVDEGDVEGDKGVSLEAHNS